MVWKADAPQGDEAAKVRLDLVHYFNGRCVDLGCGPRKVWPHVIGVDNGADTKLFGIPMQPDLQVDTCEALPVFGDAAFDCVFSSHLLEHIRDHRRALREWWRIVKPGGVLILYLPHKDLYPNIGQPGANPDHKHDFLPQDIITAMAEVAANWDLEVNEDRSAGYEYSFLQVYRKTEKKHPQHSWRKPKPAKTCALVRLGAYGDAIMGASVLPQLKREGYHVTVYTERAGEEVLRHDPHIDEIRVQPKGIFADSALLVAYWLNEERKYDRFINLCGSVERRSLVSPQDQEFYLPHDIRKRLLNSNYLETIHLFAGVPFDRHAVAQRFYPTEQEKAWALAERAQIDGPVVVVNPGGSTAPKWWPHTQRLLELLAEHRVHAVVLGDLRGHHYAPVAGFGRVIGTDWPMRKAMAFAQQADVVIGTESAIVNAVAFEPMLKLVLLSHSTHENLTRDWTETIGVQPVDVPCWPCHRLHANGWTHCSREKTTQAALCQAVVSAEQLAEEVTKYLAWKAGLQQEAA